MITIATAKCPLEYPFILPLDDAGGYGRIEGAEATAIPETFSLSWPRRCPRLQLTSTETYSMAKVDTIPVVREVENNRCGYCNVESDPKSGTADHPRSSSPRERRVRGQQQRRIGSAVDFRTRSKTCSKNLVACPAAVVSECHDERISPG